MKSTKCMLKILAIAVIGALSTGAAATPIVQVKDINPGSANGLQFKPSADINGRLLFWAYDTINGPGGQPWLSDGSTAGTTLISAVTGSSGALSPFPWRVSGPRAYFISNDGFTGNELWSSDGTLVGTMRLTDNPTGASSSHMRDTQPFAGGVYFVNYATGGASPDRIWKSDGSPAGTVQALSGHQTNYLSEFRTVDGLLFFFGGTTLSSTDLFRSNGTDAGTVEITGAFTSASRPYSVNERFYFVGGESSGGDELWTATTTSATTTRVKDIVVGSGTSSPEGLGRADDLLFFTANTPSSGRELWRSDGTDAGTMQLMDINAGIPDSEAYPIGAIDNILFFSANNGAQGRELWRSDGSAAGTYLVKDINPGVGHGLSLFPRAIAANRRLFFAAAGPLGSTTLWVSDGSAAGTHEVDSARPFVDAGNAKFGVANGKLLFDANSGSGTELHAVDLLAETGTLSCKTLDQPLLDSGSVQSEMRVPAGTGVTISDLNVRLDLGHTYLGDLTVTLTHVDTGTSVILLDRPGRTTTGSGCSGDLLDIMVDDSASREAETACVTGRPAYARDASFRPIAPLSAFSGQNIGGSWRLSVQDSAAQDLGTLHEWCLHFNDTIFASGWNN